jgi:hypothetical protein
LRRILAVGEVVTEKKSGAIGRGQMRRDVADLACSVSERDTVAAEDTESGWLAPASDATEDQVVVRHFTVNITSGGLCIDGDDLVLGRCAL